ncbi:urease accessory protein UreE [Litorivita sp. NS0012-18]|uniref:urease accessory protein UreE n=1 Tax=Litorivita sp. NS0012-18 TaxID=3127655 RepID=UPI003105E303
MSEPRATQIERAAQSAQGAEAAPDAVFADRIALSYEARFLRRKRLVAQGGIGFLVDLPKAESLDAGDAFVLADGRRILIEAEPEALIAVRGDVLRMAWHIGNRHTPCQIEGDCLYIQEDKVLADMLRGLGARLAAVTAPFTPEGGAYGMGRTHAHAHGHTHFGADGTPQGGTAHKDLAVPEGAAHEHAHGHSHTHGHAHAQSHDHSHAHPHPHDHSHDHPHDHSHD